MEDVYFDFNGLVKDIRRRKPSNVVPLLNYLSNEYHQEHYFPAYGAWS